MLYALYLSSKMCLPEDGIFCKMLNHCLLYGFPDFWCKYRKESNVDLQGESPSH